MIAVSFLVSFGVTFALNLPHMTLPLFLLFLIVALFYPKYGKSCLLYTSSEHLGLLRTKPAYYEFKKAYRDLLDRNAVGRAVYDFNLSLINI